MANAYATIANGGEAASSSVIDKVVDRDGETLYEHAVRDQRGVSEDIAADVDVRHAAGRQEGTGTGALALGRPAAGKTGTATNANGARCPPAWFVGFTPQLSTAVMYVRGDGDAAARRLARRDFGGHYPARRGPP
jgi:membrane peptidoglycan carboxypeptidase